MGITLALGLAASISGGVNPPPTGGAGAAWIAPSGNVATDGELSGAKLIDSVVAIVGRRVVTLSQLHAEARLALLAHGALSTAEGPLSDGLLRSTLDYVISENLVEEEAARLGVFPVTAAECLVAQEALEARCGGHEAFEAFLARFDIDPERLTTVLRRGLRSKRYLENRLRLQIQVSDAEVDALLVRAATDPSLPRARPLARAYLQRARYQALAAKLVQDLRSHADVRILANFGASAGLFDPRGLGPRDGGGESSALLDSRSGAAPP